MIECWLGCVVVAFPAIYIKFPLDNIFDALEKLGVDKAKIWTNFSKQMNYLQLSPELGIQNRLSKMFEQFTEAVPQLCLAYAYYINNVYYIWYTDFLGPLPLPTTIISMIFSSGSVSMGVFNGIAAFKLIGTVAKKAKNTEDLKGAIDGEDFEQMKTLVKKGNTDFNAKSVMDGNTALITSAGSNKTELAQMLIDCIVLYFPELFLTQSKRVIIKRI